MSQDSARAHETAFKRLADRHLHCVLLCLEV